VGGRRLESDTRDSADATSGAVVLGECSAGRRMMGSLAELGQSSTQHDSPGTAFQVASNQALASSLICDIAQASVSARRSKNVRVES
jgi:hypothetical protein